MITFSKHRQGLLKKAHEYSHFTGAEVAVLVFSPAGKPFVHESPSFEVVIQKLINDGNSDSEGVENVESETEVSVFLVGLEEKLNGCRSGDELDAMKAELVEVREKVLRRMRHLVEDEFVNSLLNI